MYKLYNYQPSGNCYKIRLLLAQLNIPFELIDIDILKKESRTSEFLSSINPNGRVPVLQVGDRFLPESNAALWYLAKNTPYLPMDDFEQAEVLQWLFFEQFSHEPHIASVRYWISILKAEDQYKDQITLKRKWAYAALDVMDAHLSTHAFFVGGQYSIADIALYAYTHVAHEGGFDLSGYDSINRWFRAVESQAGYVTLSNS